MQRGRSRSVNRDFSGQSGFLGGGGVSYPRISFRPSMTRASSSSEARPILAPRRSTDKVRIWLILIHERFVTPAALLSRVNGNPARGSWLVNATAITVPERSLKTSWLKTRTGRRPDCSCPRTGSRSAQRTSPLSIRATSQSPRRAPRQRDAFPREDRAWPTRGPAWCGPDVPACRPGPPRWPGSDCGSDA